MSKGEAVELFVERSFNAFPQEWAQIVAENKNEDVYSWPMWGTMWLVDSFIGERLMDSAIQVCEPSECENHDKYETCDMCEDSEEMGGAWNIKDKDGRGTAAYIYELDGQYIVGVHGAGWNFYHGVWDKLYDLLDLKWHEHD